MGGLQKNTVSSIGQKRQRNHHFAIHVRHGGVGDRKYGRRDDDSIGRSRTDVVGSRGGIAGNGWASRAITTDGGYAWSEPELCMPLPRSAPADPYAVPLLIDSETLLIGNELNWGNFGVYHRAPTEGGSNFLFESKTVQVGILDHDVETNHFSFQGFQIGVRPRDIVLDTVHLNRLAFLNVESCFQMRVALAITDHIVR